MTVSDVVYPMMTWWVGGLSKAFKPMSTLKGILIGDMKLISLLNNYLPSSPDPPSTLTSKTYLFRVPYFDLVIDYRSAYKSRV